MDFKNIFSPEEQKKLERSFLFSYLKVINSWFSSVSVDDPGSDEAMSQASLMLLYFCVDVLESINYEENTDAKEKIDLCIKIARTSIFTLAWELSRHMFFLGAACPEDPPKDSTSLAELYDRAKGISRFAAKDYIDLTGSEINPVFSKAESELFRNAIFEAVKEVMSMEQCKYAIFYSPNDSLALYSDLDNLEDSKKVFLTLQDDKFVMKASSDTTDDDMDG